MQLRLDQVIHGNGVEKRRGQSRMTFGRYCECMHFVEDEGSILYECWSRQNCIGLFEIFVAFVLLYSCAERS